MGLRLARSSDIQRRRIIYREATRLVDGAVEVGGDRDGARLKAFPNKTITTRSTRRDRA